MPTTAASPRAHAEVERLTLDGTVLRIDGALARLAGEPPGDATLVAVRRGDGERVDAEVVLDGASFAATLDLARLRPAGEETEWWELSLLVAGGARLRLARRLDDVPHRHEAYVFPALELPGRRLRPYLTQRSNLAVRSVTPRARPLARTVPDPVVAPEAPPRPPVLRRAAHRVAFALAGWRLRRRAPGPAPSGRPRITFLLLNAWGMGGTVRTTLSLAGQLAERHDVEVLSVVRNAEDPFFRFPRGVRVTAAHDLREGVGAQRGPRGRLRGWLSRRGSVLFHPADRGANKVSLWTDRLLLQRLAAVPAGTLVATRPALGLLAAAARRPGRGAVVAEHMNLDSHAPDLRAAILRTYPRADAVVVLTDDDRATYERVAGDAIRLERIPNAVPVMRSSALAALERPVVIAAGRLVRQKGFDRLIPAFARVAERHPDWTLRIFGDGPQRRRLRRLVLEHGLSNHVVLPGAVKRLGVQMERASVYVLSSRFEGLPMVMLEAMGKGLPVVSFDCPTGPGEIIEDGVTGLLVADGDEQALADALVRLIEDADERRALGAAAARKAGEFSLEAIAGHWDALLGEVAGTVAAHVPPRA